MLTIEILIVHFISTSYDLMIIWERYSHPSNATEYPIYLLKIIVLILLPTNSIYPEIDHG